MGAREARRSSVEPSLLGCADRPAPAQPERAAEQAPLYGVRVRGFEVTSPSLEDRFVALTGEGFDVAG